MCNKLKVVFENWVQSPISEDRLCYRNLQSTASAAETAVAAAKAAHCAHLCEEVVNLLLDPSAILKL